MAAEEAAENMANPCNAIRKKRLTTTAELLIVHVVSEQGANQLHAKPLSNVRASSGAPTLVGIVVRRL